MRSETITVHASYPLTGGGCADHPVAFTATVAGEAEVPVVVEMTHWADESCTDRLTQTWRLPVSREDRVWLHRTAGADDRPWAWSSHVPFQDAGAVARHLSRMVWVGGHPYHRCHRDRPEITVWADGSVDVGSSFPQGGAGIVIPAWRTDWLEELKAAMGAGWGVYLPQPGPHPCPPPTDLPEVARVAGRFKAVTAMAAARGMGSVRGWPDTTCDYEAWAADPDAPDQVRHAARRLLEVLS